MSDDYEFNDSPNQEEKHPLDMAEHQNKLRFKRVMKAVFENLEKQPEDRMAKFPAWVYEALADLMAYSVIRESHVNRSPTGLEDFYKRQGSIETYERLGIFFSEEAVKRQSATEEDRGGK